ncbi:MAG: hypothetical protein D6681_14485 [Calditrichaeota bacterium]|nr:MAG: hypothetical protein D6681_14485 [Calditrichota bacterium]
MGCAPGIYRLNTVQNEKIIVTFVMSVKEFSLFKSDIFGLKSEELLTDVILLEAFPPMWVDLTRSFSIIACRNSTQGG